VEKATVLVRDGKIAAVGKNVAIPDDASVIDADGGTLMPGIIDPYFEVTIAGGATPDAAPRTFVGGRGRGMGFPGGGARGGGSLSRGGGNFLPVGRRLKAAAGVRYSPPQCCDQWPWPGRSRSCYTGRSGPHARTTRRSRVRVRHQFHRQSRPGAD